MRWATGVNLPVWIAPFIRSTCTSSRPYRDLALYSDLFNLGNVVLKTAAVG